MINSVSNKQVRRAVQLAGKAKARREEGLFVAEGLRMCRECAPDQVEILYVTEEFASGEENRRWLSSYRYETVSEAVMKAMADTKTPQGVLGLVRQPVWSLSDILGRERPMILVLETIQDPGNLGTLLRAGEGAGITGLTLYFILENTALEYTLASNVGIIISAAPMFSALLLWAFRRMGRPRPTFFLGFNIAMSGIALISLSGGEGLDLDPIGNLLTLGAALCWGLYGVCLEAAGGQGLTQLQATRKVFFYGLLTMLPLFPVLRPALSLEPFFAQPMMVFHILYLGLAASALCFVCWNRAMALIGTVATNVYIYLTPVITLVASALILDEPILPQAVGAIALILLGLWLSQRK